MIEQDATKVQASEAETFLQSLLNKNLRVTTTDSRMFWGQFKCTDPDSNIILAYTSEFRQPSLPAKLSKSLHISSEKTGTVKLDMPSRQLGLVVIPGEHIVKIEVEEFASQMKGGINPYADDGVIA